MYKATLKKRLFPIQRAEIVGSWAAAKKIYFYSFLGGKKLKSFFLGGGGGTPKKCIKKVPSRQENTHPAAGPETNFFFKGWPNVRSLH